MKRLLLILSIIALVASATPAARAVDVSVDFFYTNLSGGNWIEVGDYGYCWQPDVAVSNPRWRPYSDGYWVYTNLGWTWVSYEDFGWATYHYGRWLRLQGRGWVWVVGRNSDLEWGPAWVSWRTGGNYVGWAPLPPPRRPGISFTIGARIGGRADVDFDIGPSCYNFVDLRYIGEPVLRERIYEPSYNVTYVQQTVNVTNITYQNKTVYNYGPDINVVSRYSTRPIQRLTIDRQASVDVSAAAKSGALTKVEGDKLVVAAPAEIKKSAKPGTPPTVKEKITEVKADNGWSDVKDPKQQEELKKKMQTEDSKKVPPPTEAAGQAAAGSSPATSASPAASGSPAAGMSPATGASPTASMAPSGAATASPAISASPAASPKASASPVGAGKRAKPGERIQPSATGTPALGATASPAMSPHLEKAGKAKQGSLQTMPTSTPATTPREAKKEKSEHGLGASPSPKEESSKTNLNSSRSNMYKSATTPAPTAPSETSGSSSELPKEKGKAKQLEPTGGPSEPPQGGTSGGAKLKGSSHAESANAPTGASAGAEAGAEHGKKAAKEESGEKKEKGKKAEEPAATPPPQ